MHEKYYGLEEDSYRQERIQDAMAYREQGQLKESLRTWLEISYVDLNGPSETGWDPSSGSVSQKVEHSILDLALQCEMRLEDLECLFLGIAGKAQKGFRLPLLPTLAWAAIKTALSPQLEEIEAQKESKRKEDDFNRAQMDWWGEIAGVSTNTLENHPNPPRKAMVNLRPTIASRAKKEALPIAQPSLFDQSIGEFPRKTRTRRR